MPDFSDTLERVRERGMELGVYLPLGAYAIVRDELNDIDRRRVRKAYDGLVDRGQNRIGEIQTVIRSRSKVIGRRAQDVQDEARKQTRKVTKKATAVSTQVVPKLPRVAAPKTASGLPISGYASLTASEITSRLKGLTQTELAKVYKWEKSHENRATILDSIDSKLISLPIATYDGLTVDEINSRLEGLSTDELKTIRRYEADTKDRISVLEKIDTLLKLS
ncbi:MAG TPA: hypothetical protein VFK89_11925 [Actinomycetota bacterium]|nr:hypothetical protein [Actinomycetota bacterium]